MTHWTIDINCDLGEGMGNEEALMPLISSCNLACGGHAGGVKTIKKVVGLAKIHKVGVGAHPSFPDKKHFGRQKLDMPMQELTESLSRQIQRVEQACAEAQIPLHHIKMHGALYNLCATDFAYAKALTGFLETQYPKIPVYVPDGSVMAELAQGRIPLIYEAFADRNYGADGSLVSRSKKNAVIMEKHTLAQHVIRLIKTCEIKSVSGLILNINADTICVHGDTPKAVELLRYLRQSLAEESIEVRAV